MKWPDCWYLPGDWISSIRNRTGWTYKELAKRTGISERTLYLMAKDVPDGRTRKVLTIYGLLQDIKEHPERYKEGVTR